MYSISPSNPQISCAMQSTQHIEWLKEVPTVVCHSLSSGSQREHDLIGNSVCMHNPSGGVVDMCVVRL